MHIAESLTIIKLWLTRTCFFERFFTYFGRFYRKKGGGVLMKLPKKSILIFLSLLCGVYEIWGMDPSDEFEKTSVYGKTSLLPKNKEVVGELDPSHYISQFFLSADEVSQLLLPHWKRGNKEKLVNLIGGATQPVFKNLIERKIENKALGSFNDALIENLTVWKLFSHEQQAQIIIGQLIRNTSLLAVAQRIEVTENDVLSFLENTFNQTVLTNFPKLSLEHWPRDPIQHLPLQPNIKMLPATHDQKGKAGYGERTPLRGLIKLEGDFKLLHGNSLRPEGYVQPDINNLTKKQEKHLAHFQVVQNVFKPDGRHTKVPGGVTLKYLFLRW